MIASSPWLASHSRTVSWTAAPRVGVTPEATAASSASTAASESRVVTGTLIFLKRGGRLGVRGAHGIITGIAAGAALDDDTTAHVLRHSFATTLVRGGTDLVIVAELLSHARLETTRAYTRPIAEDRAKALELLPIDA